MTENQSFLQEPQGRSQFLTQSRRNFLMSAFGCAIPGAIAAKTKTSKPKPAPQNPSDFFSNLGKPEFWFGDMVDFRWNDEESGEPHSETGKVVGVAWDFSAKGWEYRIMWMSSTRFPDDHYPIDDGNKVLAREVCRH